MASMHTALNDEVEAISVPVFIYVIVLMRFLSLLPSDLPAMDFHYFDVLTSFIAYFQRHCAASLASLLSARRCELRFTSDAPTTGAASAAISNLLNAFREG